MKILTRYVLFDFLKVLFATLTATTLLMVVVGVAVEASKQGIGLVQTVRLIPFILPDALRFAVPGTTLFAACTVFGRMASANEVVATKALGISPMVLLAPVLIASFVLSGVAVVLNDVAVSWGRSGVQRVVVESVEQIAYGTLKAKRSYSSGKMAMNVKSVSGRKLLRPTLTLVGGEEKPDITITAGWAELIGDPDEGTLTFRFNDATIDVGDEGSVSWPGPYEHVVSLNDFSRKGDRTQRPSNVPLREIPGRIAEEQQGAERLRAALAATAAYDMMTGDFQGLTDPVWKSRRKELDGYESAIGRLRTEPHRRWANGASCLCFALVGAPLAIYWRRGEALTIFFVCFLPILVVYYPLLATGTGRAKVGAWPPYSVWLGNVVLLLAGLWLIRRVIRY